MKKKKNRERHTYTMCMTNEWMAHGLFIKCNLRFDFAISPRHAHTHTHKISHALKCWSISIDDWLLKLVGTWEERVRKSRTNTQTKTDQKWQKVVAKVPSQLTSTQKLRVDVAASIISATIINSECMHPPYSSFLSLSQQFNPFVVQLNSLHSTEYVLCIFNISLLDARMLCFPNFRFNRTLYV